MNNLKELHTNVPDLDVKLAMSIMNSTQTLSLPPTIESKINQYIKTIDEIGLEKTQLLIKKASMINKHLNEFYSVLGDRLSPVKTYMLYVNGIHVDHFREMAINTGEKSYYGVTINKDAQEVMNKLMEIYAVDIAEIIISGLLEYLVPKLSLVMVKLPGGYGNVMLSNIGSPYLYIPLVQYLLSNGEALLGYELRNHVWGSKINPS